MSDTLPVSTTQPGEAPRALRVFGLVAVCVGVAALAAGTFVLSYSGIHAIALQAGISPRLARGYPLLLDAMLVVVLAALLSLRGAGVPSRVLAWLTLLALLGAAAGADALHATKDKLPARATEISAAVLPWVLVFLAFVLLLAMLRHARMRRLGAGQPAAASDIMPGFHALPGQSGSADLARDALTVPRQRRPDSAIAEVGASAAQLGAAGLDQDDQAVGAELTVDAQLPPDDPSSDDNALGAVLSEPPQPEPEPTLPEPAQPELVISEPVPSEPEQSEPQPEQPEPEQPGPEQPEPEQPEPVLAESVAPEPAVVEAGSGGPAAAEPPADTRPEPAGSYQIGNDGPDEVVVSGPGIDEATPFGTISPAPTEAAESPDPDMPVFHRISSSPTPPGAGFDTRPR
jgi:outer membrane biosynthesis protein TonB